MDDTTRALLSSWEIQPIISVVLLGFGVTFSVGWWRLRQRDAHLSHWWRLLAYWVGLLLIFLALMSPVEVLSGQLFTAHMIQHLMIAMFAPPLLLAPNPLPILMWGLPLNMRRQIGHLLLSKRSRIRPILAQIGQPFVAWAAFFLFLWGWHDGNLYNLTLRSEWVHDLEHFTFFYSAMLLWWHITGAAPVFHKRFSYPVRIAFVIACVPANMIAGVVIALADAVIYTYYETIPFRTFNISVLDDQRLGGAIMWIPGSMMYVIAVIVLVTLWLNEQERDAKLRRGR